jgi:hypothetical protein
VKAQCVECKKKFDFEPPKHCSEKCINNAKCRKWRESNPDAYREVQKAYRKRAKVRASKPGGKVA